MVTLYRAKSIEFEDGTILENREFSFGKGYLIVKDDEDENCADWYKLEHLKCIKGAKNLDAERVQKMREAEAAKWRL